MSSGSGLDAAGWHELAQRLLDYQAPDGLSSVELFLHRLPEPLANEIPLPERARLLGSMLRSNAGRPTLLEVVLDVDLPPDDALAAYEESLVRNGWTTFEGFGGMHGGFVPAGIVGTGRVYRHGRRGPVLMVAAMAREAALTDLRLRLDSEIVRHLPQMQRNRPEGADRLPPLQAPSGIPLRGGGGGGGDGRWYSEAAVDTDMPVAEVESHFAKQLERAGWKRLAGSADDTVAWSSWEVPGKGSWRGLLLVLGAFRPNERVLSVHVESDSQPRGSWSAGGIMSLKRA
ncbi:MAG TPA: hypothetical protein VLR46_11610 [Candidatus Dormibacteraeota bacterium]|nr:hypothetical protein [Candidatus Dormibacteraeota bacterium]